jgi:hypothetical protein
MTKILFKVDVRKRASLHKVLTEQHPRRAEHGERSFTLYVEDDARHIGYVLLEWESLNSAQLFLESPESHALVNEWPVEEVFAARALQNIGETLDRISANARDA